MIDDSTLSPELILTYVPRWPLIVNLLSACFCFGCSATFHQFQITSHSVRKILHKFDLGGICFLIMGSGIPLCWYPFACEPTHHARNVFLAVLTISSCTTFLMIMIPAISKPKFRPLRVALFITLGVSDVVPFIYLKNYS